MPTLTTVCPECHTPDTVTVGDTASYICTHCQAELDDPFPIEVTDESCQTFIHKDTLPVLVDFYSTVCGPCMAMYDDYEDAALAFGMKVRFLKINADEQQQVAREYGVSGLPTIIAFKNGKEVNRVSAQMTQVQLSLWAQDLERV